ncbi:MAG: DNA-3-methyladenine glycosylase 2 family protein [Selenomonadaceae bacterium]|nr:DNA-3-methyladenine glycosylase 2 family protein [Selenomonadaceae bacterium]
MRVTIKDDFDLNKTANCGQCFRAKEIDIGIYRFITNRNVVYIRKLEDTLFDVSCDADEWINIWEGYFDLATDYQKIRSDISKLNDYLRKAAQIGEGIRILKQDPFETLISFIISQRKSIPSIKTSVERIAAKYGSPITTKYETINSFPTLEEMKSVSPLDLSGCGLAYRADYIRDAIEKLLKGDIVLDMLWNKGDEELIDELKKIRGVGDKVANCVALFAYHRVDRVPIDVWIARAIDDDFNGHNFFADIEQNAGIAQQYVFYAKKFAKK